MQFEWPTSEQMIYRINRLRRLVLVAVLIPVSVLLLGSFFDPTFLSPDRATIASLAVASLISGHVVMFPNASLETISLSISVTVMAVAAPWIKVVSLMAPAEHATAALVLLTALTVMAAGGLMLMLQLVLSALMMAGPVIKFRLCNAVDVPCSTDVARRQFALQPNARRGRILTGAADDNGFFDVAILAPQVIDQQNPEQPFVVRICAKIVEQDENQQQTMLVLPNGGVTVTAERFIPTADGCRVEITEMPGDFTLGMYALFWLTDQQMDNLTESVDIIVGAEPRANGVVHGVSLLSVAGAILSPNQPIADRAE